MPVSMAAQSTEVQNQGQPCSGHLDTNTLELAEVYGDIESPKSMFEENPTHKPEAPKPVLDRFQSTVNSRQTQNSSTKVSGHGKGTAAHVPLSAATVFDPNLSLAQQYLTQPKLSTSLLTSDNLASHDHNSSSESYQSNVSSSSSSGHLSVVSSIDSSGEQDVLIRPAVFTKFRAMQASRKDDLNLQHIVLEMPDHTWAQEAQDQRVREPCDQRLYLEHDEQVQVDAHDAPFPCGPIKKGALTGGIIGAIIGIARLNPIAVIGLGLFGALGGMGVGMIVSSVRVRRGQI